MIDDALLFLDSEAFRRGFERNGVLVQELCSPSLLFAPEMMVKFCNIILKGTRTGDGLQKFVCEAKRVRVHEIDEGAERRRRGTLLVHRPQLPLPFLLPFSLSLCLSVLVYIYLCVFAKLYLYFWRSFNDMHAGALGARPEHGCDSSAKHAPEVKKKKWQYMRA